MRKISCFILLIAAFTGCERGRKNQPTDSPRAGTIQISADESFAPVIDDEIAMYQGSNPAAHIIAHYKAEADCLRDFFHDSATRLVIVTRGLSAKEDQYLLDSMHYRAAFNEVATDAVAVIVNRGSSDSLFTVDRLRSMLTGKDSLHGRPAFDGLSETSTVRFLKDSVLRGAALDLRFVQGVKGTDAVVDYVAAHKDAVGFVGIDRIGNPEDSAAVRLSSKVRISYVRCDACAGAPFVYPSQESILDRRYPLVRSLYYLLKENFTGLGSGFVAFLKYERGQLIFRRDYLGPSMQLSVRDVHLNEQLPKD